MKRYMRLAATALCLTAILTSCENGDAEFADFENGTTARFVYQYPVRTIILGDDENDTSIDKRHQCEIKATFGGSYNGSDGKIQVAVDNTLVNHLTFPDGSPVKAMPESYYSLSTTSLDFKGTFQGATTVQLTDAFFNDPDAVKNTYVIPLVMTGYTGFDRIATGTPKADVTPVRTDASCWDELPQDYVLYCIKYQNKYSGWWLTNGNTSTANIEKASQVEIKTRSLNSSVYTVSYQDGSQIYTADLLLTFDSSEKCTVTSLTEGVTATGSGSWGDDSEKQAWGGKDRDGIELNYSVTFADGHQFATHEKLVWWRSGVSLEEFSPTYNK